MWFLQSAILSDGIGDRGEDPGIRPMEQQAVVRALCSWFHCWLGQHVAIAILMLQE